jgi:hypothetical protein
MSSVSRSIGQNRRVLSLRTWLSSKSKTRLTSGFFESDAGWRTSAGEEDGEGEEDNKMFVMIVVNDLASKRPLTRSPLAFVPVRDRSGRLGMNGQVDRALFREDEIGWASCCRKITSRDARLLGMRAYCGTCGI